MIRTTVSFPILSFILASYLVLLPNRIEAKNLGVYGHTFTIEEPDLLDQIMGRLKGLESSGKLKNLQVEMADKARDKLRNLKSLGLPRATVTRTFEYDPSITATYDLKDPKGVVFHKAGTKVNPLDTISLSKTLVFLDGEDEEQVEWVKANYLKANPLTKLILTGGNIFDLMERWDIPIYYDQSGNLTQKLGIKAVPAIVKQSGKVLEIQEVKLSELSQETEQRPNIDPQKSPNIPLSNKEGTS